MADGVPVSRCGPLCQHPGCWHTTAHTEHGQHKDTEYTRFLSELLLRKKELKRLQNREGAGLHSTRTSDGLPTLKVQSINQKLLEGRDSAQRRRSKTLPPLKISTRKCAGSVMQRYRESPSKASTMNYVQMQLQVDQEALDSDLCSELVFSPVLLWRPGRAQRHPPPPSASAPAHETTKISNEKTKHPNQSSTTTHPTSSSLPHPLPRPQHTPPPATHVATHKDEDKDRSVWRTRAENLSMGRKGPLLIKTTDLTNALPPQTSFESPLHNENKDITSAAKYGKARHKLTTADAECFSYLGDIPPQVVAEILHQLRSESSSNIDGTTTRPPHSTAHHIMIHTTEKSQKAYQSTTTQPRVPIPMASLLHLSTSSNTAHVPASLAYELSTHKVLKPEPVRPRRRVSSFSRELSKRPLEVLRRRSGRPNATGEEEVLERITIPKIISNEENKESFAKESEWTVLKQSAKRHSHQMHLPTAEIEPPTDLPAAGVRPHYQPSLAADLMQGNPPTHHQHTVETKPAQVRFHSPPTSAVHNHNNIIIDDHNDFIGPPTATIEDGGGAQPRVPSTILLQLNADTVEQCELHPLSGFDSKRSRVGGHNIMVHSPRHRVLAPNSSVVCPFSEEASPSHELETRGLLLKRRLQSRERKSRDSRREQSAVSAEHEHPPHLPSSVSPDYMLVGAHFADNNLVLVDKDGKIVHQLTDTEGESDANIIAHLSELNIHTQLSVEPHVVPRMESLTSEEGQSTAEVSKPGTGMQAPPPTALEHGRESVEGEEEEEKEEDNMQILIQVPKVEEIPQTEADLGEIGQETETEEQPNNNIINHDDNETKERGSQDEEETLETVENDEAERRDYREVQAELKSEDERERTPHDTVPTAEQKEDKIPESKSVEEFEGAAEVPELGESEISRELQGRTPPEEHSKSEDENEPARIDPSVEEVPVPITEQQRDYEDSEENSA